MALSLSVVIAFRASAASFEVQGLLLHQGRVDPLLPFPTETIAPDNVPLPIWQWQGRHMDRGVWSCIESVEDLRLSLVQAMPPLIPNEGSASRPTIAASYQGSANRPTIGGYPPSSCQSNKSRNGCREVMSTMALLLCCDYCLLPNKTLQ